MQCTVCKKQKAELQLKESKVWKKAKILMCQTCINEKKEPRGFIILAFHSGKDVKDYIKNHRYVGDEITGKELLGK